MKKKPILKLNKKKPVLKLLARKPLNIKGGKLA